MNFGFLLFDDVEELDFIGPWEIVGVWSKHFEGPEQCLLISQSGEVVQCAQGLKVIPDYNFETCPTLDYLLVPGGHGTRREVENIAFLNFIQKQAANCQHVLSVCTGAFILQAAGLLADKNVTAHWGSLKNLRKLPDLTVVEQRVVHDGNIWTAAGISAGIDLALALIAAQAGEETAGKVQMAVEYYPAPVRYGKAHLSPELPAYLRQEVGVV
ncbi:MAG: DJ-1/PfpI family protein [Anaerolineales bacterium]|nr:DJ-1/PfpI family protein [Anaerolineales bacterium]